MIESTNRKLVVLAACLLPALALADAPPADAPGAAPAAAAPAAAPAAPPAEARPLPRWSFGGGVGYSFFTYAPESTFGDFDAQVPTVAASLERRLSRRSWLVLGVAGSYWRNRRDVPDGSYGYSRDDARQLTASLGLRRALTRPAAPVEVSIVVAAQGGVRDQELRAENRYNPLVATSSTRFDATTWFAGAEVGLAVERELTEGLALRVASPLVGGRYGKGSVRTAGQPDRSSSVVSAGVVLAPRLELRLLF